MRIAIHPEAEEELSAAALWYEGQQAGLGDDFVNEFESTLHRILREPAQWRVFQGDNRKLNFHRFPYTIVYSLQGGDTLPESRDASLSPAVLLAGSPAPGPLTSRGFS